MNAGKKAVAIAKRIRPLLAKHPLDVQGAVLATLLSASLASHQGPDGLADQREEILTKFVATVREMISILDAAIERRM